MFAPVTTILNILKKLLGCFCDLVTISEKQHVWVKKGVAFLTKLYIEISLFHLVLQTWCWPLVLLSHLAVFVTTDIQEVSLLRKATIGFQSIFWELEKGSIILFLRGKHLGMFSKQQNLNLTNCSLRLWITFLLLSA